jgi:hypothetical protein
VTAAYNVASQRYTSARFSGADPLGTTIRELLLDALTQISAGLPPPTPSHGPTVDNRGKMSDPVA